MRKILWITGLTLLVFVVLTWITSSIETPFDGNDEFGFPFRFYEIYGGKRSFYPPNEFSAVMLFLDFVFVVLAVWLSKVALTKLKTKNENA